MSAELLTVFAVTLVTWLGILIYLWRLDTRVKDLERDLQRKNR